MQKPTATSRQELAMLSKKVASGVTEIVHAAEAIKGRSHDTYSSHTCSDNRIARFNYLCPKRLL